MNTAKKHEESHIKERMYARMTHENTRMKTYPPYACKICNRIFTQENELEVHLRFHARPENQPYHRKLFGRKFWRPWE